MKNQTILITGAGGYLAAALVRLLKDRPCRVVRLGRCRERFPSVRGSAEISDVSGDIRDAALWESVLEGVDVVFHLAAQTSVPVAEQDPWKDAQANVAPMLHLLQTCRRNGWHPSVLFSSTVTITGIPVSVPVAESHPENPITIYDLHKQMAENYLKYFAAGGWIRGAVLRLANVYGPGPTSGSADRGVLNQMIRKALDGEALTVYGSGDEIRDYVYVDDVAGAFLEASAHMEAINGRHFMIGSGSGCSIRQAVTLVAERVLRATGSRPEVRHVEPPGPRPRIDSRNFIADIGAFAGATGWRPAIGLEEGLDRTIQSCLKRPERS